jgi:hypothetical protein
MDHGRVGGLPEAQQLNRIECLSLAEHFASRSTIVKRASGMAITVLGRCSRSSCWGAYGCCMVLMRNVIDVVGGGLLHRIIARGRIITSGGRRWQCATDCA